MKVTYRDVTIFIIELIRETRSSARTHIALLTWGLVVAWPASAIAAEGRPAGAREREGLPFSIVDFGWITLAAVVLIVVALTLRGVARHRRRTAQRALGHRRTDP